MDKKLDEILAYQKLQDFHFKLLIDKINNLTSILEKTQIPIPADQPAATAARVHIDDQLEETKVSVPQRNQRVPATASSKNASILGRLVYPDGKNVILADIKLLSETGEILKSTRSNSVGKYSFSIPIGKYVISYFKPAVSDKPEIKKEKHIEILNTDAPFEIKD